MERLQRKLDALPPEETVEPLAVHPVSWFLGLLGLRRVERRNDTER